MTVVKVDDAGPHKLRRPDAPVKDVLFPPETDTRHWQRGVYPRYFGNKTPQG